MVELIRTEYPRQVVKKIVESSKEEIACALIYGSYAKNSGKPLTDESDIDLVLIFKVGANPIPVVEQIENAFERMHVFYDTGWYTEEKFFELLEAKIDLCLWWSLFTYGEILYSEQGVLERIYAVLRDSNPVETFSLTRGFRTNRIRQLARAIVRNIHRVVIDAIWALYYKDKDLSSWNELPSYYTVVEKALAEGIIGNNVAFLARHLEKLRKKMENRSCQIDLIEIHVAWELANLFISKVHEGKTMDEINSDIDILLKQFEKIREALKSGARARIAIISPSMISYAGTEPSYSIRSILRHRWYTY